MLGLPDEYPGARRPNKYYQADVASVMHCGETVQPLHYVFFADWIGRQWHNYTSLVKPSDWKVNGTIDLLNARL